MPNTPEGTEDDQSDLEYDPYDFNGGTVLAIAGEDFVVVASDTRLSSEMIVLSRDTSKLFSMTPIATIASTGCWCDTISLTSLLKVRIQRYELEHRKMIATESLANMISTVMYNRRFFPYFTCTILAGLDREGKGAVYYYDPLGHYQRCRYRVLGTTYALLLPAMDLALGWEHHTIVHPKDYPPLTIRRAVALATNCLLIATDRDVYSGDSGIIQVLTKDGVETRKIELRID